MTSSAKFNQACVARLREAGLSRGNFVIVVGAGASMPLIPGGKDLQTRVAKACRIRPGPEEPYWDVFERALLKDPEAYCRTIDEAIPGAKRWHGEIYQHIVRLPNRGIITFNYDQYLPKAFGEEHKDFFAQANPPTKWQRRFSTYSPRLNSGFPGISAFNGTPLLVAIHGYRGPERPNIPSERPYPDWPQRDIILSKSQFLDHYFERPLNLCSWWRDLFASYPVLFVCTALREPGVSAALRSLVSEKHPSIEKHPRILLQPAEFKTRDILGKKVSVYAEATPPFEGIEALRFDPTAEYEGLLDILVKFDGKREIGELSPDFPAFSQHPDFRLS